MQILHLPLPGSILVMTRVSLICCTLRGIISKYNDFPLYEAYETPGLKYIIRNSILYKNTFVLQDVQ